MTIPDYNTPDMLHASAVAALLASANFLPPELREFAINSGQATIVPPDVGMQQNQIARAGEKAIEALKDLNLGNLWGGFQVADVSAGDISASPGGLGNISRGSGPTVG